MLNNQDGLRPETIARVRKAMEETGFTVNAHALHLRGKPTAMIGVCMEDFVTPTAVGKLSVLQDLLRAKGYTALIEVLKPGTSQKVVQHFLSLRVDAMVFIGHFPASELEQRIAELHRHAIPHLIVDHPGIHHAHTVTLDRVEAMIRVMNHLLDLGHRRFGIMGISGPYRTVADRLHGVSEALTRRGLDIATCVKSLDYLHVPGDHFEHGRLLAQSFAKAKDLPTAFIAVNDETAVGAMLEFQTLGLRVPDDLSIVGFNNQNICLMTKPNLTSVDHQIERSMEVAADTILQQIYRPVTGESILRMIEPVLVARGSTGPAPRGK